MMLGGKEGGMLESRTIPTAMRGGISASHPDAGNALGQAITALRRGEPVLIRDNEISVLAVAAELATEENLRRLREISAGPMSVVLTRHRAVALGLPCDIVNFRLFPTSGHGHTQSRRSGGIARRRAGRGRSRAGRRRGRGARRGRLGQARLMSAGCSSATRRGSRCPLLAQCRDLASIEAAAVFKYDAAAGGLERVAEARVPLADAENARMIAFRPRDGGGEHLAILIGAPDPAAPVLVRLHSECFTGDLLASLRCDRRDQLRGAIAAIARAGGGVLLYLAQEGRGIGLLNKRRAYQLQDAGFDTLDANEQPGFDVDERVYLPAAEMLRQLGFGMVRLLTNNPDKVVAMGRYGIRVAERVSHVFPSSGYNEHYLCTKGTRSGHFL